MPSARIADARGRLLEAAIDVFGRHGYAGATTRAIAKQAGLNLQAIAYHFGGKEGLYLAAADHLADRMRALLEPMAARARARFADPDAPPVTADEARAMLTGMFGSVAGILFDDAWTPVARFMVREQMDPTEAFDHIYERLVEPTLATARHVVAVLVGAPADSQRVRLRTLSLIGSIMFFRIAHGAATRQLGWTRTGPRELAAIRELVEDTIASVGRVPKRSS